MGNIRQNQIDPKLWWSDLIPTRDEFIEMIKTAAVHLDPSHAKRVYAAVKGMKQVAWGADYYAGADCPLKAAGFKRTSYRAWGISGAQDFESTFDSLMTSRTCLHGPGMISIRNGETDE